MRWLIILFATLGEYNICASCVFNFFEPKLADALDAAFLPISI
jgi:hypothetical protein